MKLLFLIFVALTLILTYLMITRNPTPPYLYKVVSYENWEESQDQESLKLDTMDDAFIHLSTEAQLDRIISKFWSSATSYVVLKLNTKILKGRLVFEANPGGTNKYYHLYDGSIPMNSVVDTKVVDKSEMSL